MVYTVLYHDLYCSVQCHHTVVYQDVYGCIQFHIQLHTIWLYSYVQLDFDELYGIVLSGTFPGPGAMCTFARIQIDIALKFNHASPWWQVLHCGRLHRLHQPLVVLT